MSLDSRLFLDVNDFQRATGWLHGVGLAYAKLLGPGLLAGVLLAGVLVGRRRGAPTLAAALWAGLSTLVAVGLNQPLVHTFDRARPYAALRHVSLLGTPSVDGSFPSDHATLAGAALVGLLFVDRRLGLAATAAGLLLAAARVYVGAHYPGDVLAGLIVGGVVAGLGWLVLRHPLTALVELLARTRLRRVLTAA